MTFWDITSIFEALLALTLFVFLLRLTIKTKVYLPLLLFTSLSLIISSVTILTYEDQEHIKTYHYLVDALEPFTLLFGLLMFLYARNQVYQKFVFSRKDILYFIPFGLSVLTYLQMALQGSADESIQNQLNISSNIKAYIWEWNLYLLVNGTFMLMAVKAFETYNEKLKAQLSNIKQSNLYRTQLLIKACLGLYILEGIFVYSTLFGFPYYNMAYDVINLLCGIFLLLIGLDAILSFKSVTETQGELLPIPLLPTSDQEKREVKYASSGLTEESSQDIKEQLIIFMDEQKPYLTPKLKIKDLSELTQIPAHHISQVLNEMFEKNFYEFINEYRVKDAMAILKNPKFKNHTYESIAFDVGFNSRSAFYNAFKKVYNTTPSKIQNTTN